MYIYIYTHAYIDIIYIWLYIYILYTHIYIYLFMIIYIYICISHKFVDLFPIFVSYGFSILARNSCRSSPSAGASCASQASRRSQAGGMVFIAKVSTIQWFIQWKFQDPKVLKWRYCTICYNIRLQFRFLKWPLIYKCLRSNLWIIIMKTMNWLLSYSYGLYWV